MRQHHLLRCTFFVLGLAPIHTSESAAQTSSVALQYHFLEDSKLKDPIPGVENSADVKFAIGAVDFSARLPFWGTYAGAEAPKNPTRATEAYLSFQRKFIEEELFSESRESDDLYAFGAQLRFFAALSNSWGWAVVGGAKLPVSVVEKAQPRDLTYQAGGMIRYSTWANGTIGLGVLYSQHTGASLVLPLLHADLHWFSGKLRFEATPWAPIEPRASLMYRPSAIWSLGVGAILTGDLYALTDTTVTLFAEDGDVIAENVNAGLAMAEFMVGPEFRVHSGTLELVFVGGMAVFRRFDFRAIDEGETLRIPTDDLSRWVPAEFDLESTGTLLIRGTARF